MFKFCKKCLNFARNISIYIIDSTVTKFDIEEILKKSCCLIELELIVYACISQLDRRKRPGLVECVFELGCSALRNVCVSV